MLLISWWIVSNLAGVHEQWGVLCSKGTHSFVNIQPQVPKVFIGCFLLGEVLIRTLAHLETVNTQRKGM